MSKTPFSWMRRALSVAVVTFTMGCGDEIPAGPDAALLATLHTNKRDPDLSACQNLRAPAGSKLAFHTFATGVQIYRWNGTSWSFVAPEAVLTEDAGGNGVVGTHYAGPTWESNSGSKVVGALVDRCTPNPNAIPWLLLRAVSNDGPGIFQRVTSIQRVNTVGGLAPATSGTVVGEEARVPYTTEYFFYRLK
ncbi:MAG: DUF3455 domain-containing protein [Gemmatimonadota bacterium]